MPEEVNRIVTDHLSSILFTTTVMRMKIFWRRVLTTTGFSCRQCDDRYSNTSNELINESTIISELGLVPGNTTSYSSQACKCRFSRKSRNNFSKIAEIGYDKKWIFPAHPRTLSKIRDFKLESSFLSAIQPLGYNDFSKLVKTPTAFGLILVESRKSAHFTKFLV